MKTAIGTDNDEEKTNTSCAVKINQETIPRIDSMLENIQLKLADGSKIDIVTTKACQKVSNKEKQMPVMQGTIGNNQVQTLRDTGCNGVHSCEKGSCE